MPPRIRWLKSLAFWRDYRDRHARHVERLDKEMNESHVRGKREGWKSQKYLQERQNRTRVNASRQQFITGYHEGVEKVNRERRKRTLGWRWWLRKMLAPKAVRDRLKKH